MRRKWEGAIRKILEILVVVFVGGLMVFQFSDLFTNPDDWRPRVEKFIPEDGKAFAENYVALVRAHKFDEALKLTDPNLLKEHPVTRLSKIASAFPPGEPVSITAVGADILKSEGKPALYHLLFEYEFPQRWIGIEILLGGPKGHLQAEGMHAILLKDSAEHANRFTFEGKGIANYIAFAGAIFLIFVDYGLFILCIRQESVRFKWLWAFFILVGIAQVNFNWTVGKFSPILIANVPHYLDYIFLGLPVVQFSQAAFSPLIIRFSMPVGAFLFWWHYQEHKR